MLSCKMASPMDQSNLYSAEYIYNNVTYAVTNGMEIHERLSTDPDYFNMYMRENINGNEAAAAEAVTPETATTPETPEIPESEECNPTDNTFEWKKQNVLLLLDAYRQRLQKFRDPKVKRKNLWMEIVHQFNNHGCRNVSIEILDRKMRNMKKTYRDIRDKNKKTGSGRVAWEYFDTFGSIFADDRTINFGHTISSSRLVGIPPPLPPLRSPPLATPPVSPLLATPPLATPPFSDASSSDTMDMQYPDDQAYLTSDSISERIAHYTSTPLANSPLLSTSAQVSGTRPNKRNKSLYSLRKQQIEIEAERVTAIKDLTKEVREANNIQEERNKLLEVIIQQRQTEQMLVQL